MGDPEKATSRQVPEETIEIWSMKPGREIRASTEVACTQHRDVEGQISCSAGESRPAKYSYMMENGLRQATVNLYS